MTVHEAAFEALNLQPGDMVQVQFKVPSYAQGWDNSWVNNMDDFVNLTLPVIKADKENGITLSYNDNVYWFPAFCLEVVARKPQFQLPDYPTQFDGKPVTVQGHNKDFPIWIGDHPISLEAFQQLYNNVTTLQSTCKIVPKTVHVHTLDTTIAFDRLTSFVLAMKNVLDHLEKLHDNNNQD